MTYTAKLHPEKVALSSISNIDNLCDALDISVAELAAAMKLSPEQRYTSGVVPKKDGSDRIINNPHHLIRKIQRRINKRIFSDQDVISWPDHVFGSIPNDDLSISPASDKDYVNCARQHCCAKSVLSVDIKDFFDNIHYEAVVSIFENFLKYPADVADALANVCCKGALLHKSEGRRDYPSPRRSYAMAPTGTVLGRPSCVKRLSRATRTCNSTTCRSNVRAITRWPRRLKQCILVSTRLLR